MCHLTENLVDDLPAATDAPPHAKACGVCAFRADNPQGLTDDDTGYLELQLAMGGFEFLCVHRPDEAGRFRGCAAWAAKVKARAAAR